MYQVKINVAKDGKTTIKAEGYQGPSCTTVTRPFIEALGRKVDETPTAEMFETEVHQEVQQ